MNLAGIEVFVKIVQLGSISSAARALGLPVSTASGQLAALEQRLGVTLIQRTTRKLHVTQAGEAYFKRCAIALAEIQTADQELAIGREEPSGLLRMTCTSDIASQLLPPLIQGYLERYPRVSVELIVTYRLVDFIAEGVDLGLRIGELKDSSMLARRFTELRASLWAAPAYLSQHGMPKHPDQLREHIMVRYRTMPDQLTLHRGHEQIRISARPGRITVDDFDSLKAFLIQGQGLGVLPDHMARADAAAGRLCQVLPDWSWDTMALRFVYPAQRFVAPHLQRFMDHCLEHVPIFA